MYAVYKLLFFDKNVETLDGVNLYMINGEPKYFIPVYEKLEDAEEASCDGKYQIAKIVTK